MELSIIHYGDIIGWKWLEQEDSIFLHQVNSTALNEITFYPFTNKETSMERSSYSVAVFKVKRKLTNMAIADNIINKGLKNLAI